MTNPLIRFFRVDSMLPRDGLRGEAPCTREAYRSVMNIALPSVMEMVLMSLIGMCDTIMVGNVLGSRAIAAVGLVDQPRMLIMAIFFALNVGVTAVVARRKGEDRRDEANRSLRNAAVVTVLLALALTAVSLIGARPLMRLAGAQADTIDDAETYFTILAWFLPVNALTMCICAAQRGVGNTRITMYVNVASNLVNVLFNFLLIGGNFGFPRLEVAGAAIATAIGFCVGLLLSLFTIFDTRRHNGFLRLSRHDDWRLRKETLSPIVNVGGNAMLEQLALRVGFFLYARIVADLGTQAFAAHQICMRFLNLSFTFGDGLGVAGTSLVGEMMGRRRPDLSHIYGKVCQRLALVAALLLAGSIVLLRYPLVSMFTRESDVVALSARVMLLVAAFQPFQTSAVVISGALRGAGDTKFVAVVMAICVAVIRPALSVLAIFVIESHWGLPQLALMGAWAASLVDMVIRLISVYARFNRGKWHEIQV